MSDNNMRSSGSYVNRIATKILSSFSRQKVENGTHFRLEESICPQSTIRYLTIPSGAMISQRYPALTCIEAKIAYKTPSRVPPTIASPSSTNLIAETLCRSIDRWGCQVPDISRPDDQSSRQELQTVKPTLEPKPNFNTKPRERNSDSISRVR